MQPLLGKRGASLKIILNFCSMNPDRLPRIASIDILRAVTMLLMIFVNDLWTLTDIPGWLEHTEKMTDGMGLADTVFPAFLVIVGMSLPFAIDARTRKGDSDPQLLRHVLERSLALIVMGVFLVNGESISENGTGMSAGSYNTLAALSFILIWNAYPTGMNKGLKTALKLAGAVVLIGLAWAYRGGHDSLHRFSTSWWGILGLIGWAYLLCSVVFVLVRGRIIAMAVFWVVCLLFSASFHAGLIPEESVLSRIAAPLGHGAMPALVSGGAVSSLLFIRFTTRQQVGRLITVFLLAGLGCIGIGFFLRHWFIISKILATPSWVLICTGITLLVFVPIYWIADVQKKTSWAAIVRPAGTNTLLCYLLPYFAYAIADASHIVLPDAVTRGGIGLIKTLAFALLMVSAAGWLENLRIKIKL